MSAKWKAELEELKQQPIEELEKMEEKEQRSGDLHKRELSKLMKLVKFQLMPVVDVFRDEGNTQQPHIHEYKDGYTLVLPITKPGLAPIILRLQFEFQLAEKGYVLKVKREIGETIGPERIILAPITDEEIRSEVRELLKERQSLVLNVKKRAS
jgi:hypothetical protein